MPQNFKRIFSRTWFVVFFLFGCGAFRDQPPKTELEVREIQTRTFEGVSVPQGMKALINVLQDDGYIIHSADAQLGYLTASKEDDVSSGWNVFFNSEKGRWAKTRVTEVTGNVSEVKRDIKVRANFRRRVLDNQGDVMNVESIGDADFYQKFFIKVDKSLFLLKEKVSLLE